MPQITKEKTIEQVHLVVAAATAIIEVVEEAHPEPAPKTSIYLALQCHGLSMNT